MAAEPATGDVPVNIAALTSSACRVTVLTGAGMSAESGVPTFRDAQTGLWSAFSPEDLATPQAWARDREFVWAWYAWRMTLVRDVAPNAGHVALAQWSALPGVDLRIVTQNVDDLHERAGSTVLAHVHGSLLASRCEACSTPYDGDLALPTTPIARLAPPRCAACGAAVRPGVVWFGEMLPERALRDAEQACTDADLVLVVGTSGVVYPVAELPRLALAAGVPVVEINPEVTPITRVATESWRTTAAVGLPALVAGVQQG